jgi:hypothetical protein
MKNLLITTLIIIASFAPSFGTIVVTNGLTKIHDLNAKGISEGMIVLKIQDLHLRALNVI